MSAPGGGAQGLDLWSGFASEEAARACAAAAAACARGDAAEAERLALAALAADPNASPAHDLLSALRLPGPRYLQLLAELHRLRRPRAYVEIGVFKGESLALAGPECRALGVDPAPQVEHPGLVRMESDAFFASGEAAARLGPAGFDLAFVDGLHQFEQALRDFVHLEALAAPGALIAIHDTLPLDAVTSAPVRTTTFYTGDVWKVALVLHETRPDLRLRTVATAPSGLTLVGGLDRRRRVSARALAALSARYGPLGFADYQARGRAALGLVPASGGAAAALAEALRDDRSAWRRLRGALVRWRG